MSIYIWIAAMGVVGLIGLLLFIYSLSKDLKMKRKRKLSRKVLIPNWLLLIFSICCFSMMVYFFLNIKDQLIQFGS